MGQLLRPPHHAKWHDVNLFAQLPGYRRFPPAADWLAGYEALEPGAARKSLQGQFEAFLAARGARFSPAQREQLYRNLLEYLSGRR